MFRLRRIFYRTAALLAAVLCIAAPVTAQASAHRDQPIPLTDGQDAADGQQTPNPNGDVVEPTEFDTSVMNDDMTAVLIDADSGEVLFEHKPDEIILPASTTKIMTGLLAIELNNGTLDGEVTLGPEVNAFSRTSSLLGLKEHYTVSVQDLLYGLMLVSGNDAAAALAVHFAGSIDNFVALMNQKAQELGMTNTRFSNPHGLDLSSVGMDHHSTAADMAKLARAAYANPVLMQIMGTPSYEITTTELNDNIRTSAELHNGNYLLDTPVQEPQRSRYAQFRYQPTTGMKTGLLQNADGHKYYGCLVASASRDGRNLIAAIFADTSDYGEDGAALDRWRTAIALFEYGFMGFIDVDVSPFLTSFQTTIPVTGAASNDPGHGAVDVAASSESPATINIKRADAVGLVNGSVAFDMIPQLAEEQLAAPVAEGRPVGTLSCQINGQEILVVPLVAARSVYAAGDEAETSEEYGVPNPTGLQWWMWALIIGGAAGTLILVYVIIERRRYMGRYIGKHRKSRMRYPRNWNDDIPLSALRTRGPSEPPRRKSRR